MGHYSLFRKRQNTPHKNSHTLFTQCVKRSPFFYTTKEAETIIQIMISISFKVLFTAFTAYQYLSNNDNSSVEKPKQEAVAQFIPVQKSTPRLTDYVGEGVEKIDEKVADVKQSLVDHKVIPSSAYMQKQVDKLTDVIGGTSIHDVNAYVVKGVLNAPANLDSLGGSGISKLLNYFQNE